MLGGYDMVRRRVRHKSKAFNVFMLLLFVACLFVIGKQEYSIYQIKQEQAATQQRIAALQKQKTELEAERKRLDDPRNRQQARFHDISTRDSTYGKDHRHSECSDSCSCRLPIRRHAPLKPHGAQADEA